MYVAKDTLLYTRRRMYGKARPLSHATCFTATSPVLLDTIVLANRIVDGTGGRYANCKKAERAKIPFCQDGKIYSVITWNILAGRGVQRDSTTVFACGTLLIKA